MSLANGHGAVGPGAVPDGVRDLAEACVKFVERAVGVTLDYTLETLPALDHWLERARLEATTKADATVLVAHAAGAYFGEVLRRRHASWWRATSADLGEWRVELEAVYLAVAPIALVGDLLARDTRDDGDVSDLELLDDDRAAVAQRLADLPEVSEAEFFALATRLEVIDIAVETIRARRMAEDEDPDAALTPTDYDDD